MALTEQAIKEATIQERETCNKYTSILETILIYTWRVRGGSNVHHVHDRI